MKIDSYSIVSGFSESAPCSISLFNQRFLLDDFYKKKKS